MVEQLYEFWAYLIPRLPGAAVGTVVIIVVHFALWDLNIPRIPSYVNGTLCVISGMAVSAFLLEDAWPLVNYLIHLGPPAIAMMALWQWRGHKARQEKAAYDAKEIERAAERELTG